MVKPILFLDFDRTLFDTERFYAWLGGERFSRILALTAGTIDPPDFAKLLYPDSIDFLKKARETHRLVLLSFALNLTLQRKKVRGSGVVSYLDDVIITDDPKGPVAKEYIARLGDPGWQHAFIDDAPENVSEMKETNPEMNVIRIARTYLTPEDIARGKTPPDHVVKNLAEALLVL